MADVTTVNPTGNDCIDSVLSGIRWTATSLTFSFPTSAFYFDGYATFSEPGDGFGACNATQKSAARTALKQFAAVSNITFTEISETGTQHADLRLAKSNEPYTAWAYLPDTDAIAGDVWFNNSSREYDKPVKGNYAYVTFLHEIGHAVGLKHAHEDPNAMPYAQDSMEYTVMTYRSYVGASATDGYTNETWGYAQSLMMYDIAALQVMYGANYTTNSGNTVYSWSPITGEMLINGIRQGAPGGNEIFFTLWDGGGNDTYDLSNYTTNLRIDLQPGHWTKTSSQQLAKLTSDGSKVAVGNIANALLYNGDARSLIENAVGGSGNDVIMGNDTNNRLVGNAGNDKIYGYSNDDVLVGGTGRDMLSGGDGLDYASYAGAKAGVLADLIAARSNRGDAKGDTYADIENLWGSSHADTLRGNDGANTLKGGSGGDKLHGRGGDDVLDGGAGNDTLEGQDGQDTLVGGSGKDVFVFKTVSSSSGVLIDTIADFRHAFDRIDLRGIDANTIASGNQAFIFIGQSAFDGHAGELRFADGVLYADVNGDSTAELQVNVLGSSVLVRSDFYL